MRALAVRAMVVLATVVLAGVIQVVIGALKLGRDDAEPDFPYISWLAMLFAAGMGIGLMYFGVAEPIQDRHRRLLVEGATECDRDIACAQLRVDLGYERRNVEGQRIRQVPCIDDLGSVGDGIDRRRGVGEVDEEPPGPGDLEEGAEQDEQKDIGRGYIGRDAINPLGPIGHVVDHLLLWRRAR